MNSSPKTFFKALYIATFLRAAMRGISHLKALPDELNPLECKWNLGLSKLHIPYTYEKYTIQEAMDTSTNILKITLSLKVKLHHMWSQVTSD